jgi:polyhydroxyalkanoate synthesis regulator phasin
MLDIVKKAAFAGIGIAVMTKEKVQQLAKKIVADAEAPQSEGRKFISDMVKKSEETRKALEKLVHETVTTVHERLDVPTRKDIAALEERIKKLEAR